MQSQSIKQLLIIAAHPSIAASRRAVEVVNQLGHLFKAEVLIRRTEDPRAALQEGVADFALQPADKMPPCIAKGTRIAAIPRRETAAESLLARLGGLLTTTANPFGVMKGARVWVKSSRQAAQILAVCQASVEIVEDGSNSLLQCLVAGQCDAVMLPTVDLMEHPDLGAFDVATLRPEVALPAPGQGGLVMESREDDTRFPDLATIDDPQSARCISCERHLLELFDQDPALGCLATTEPDGGIRLQAVFPELQIEENTATISRVGAVSKEPDQAALACHDALRSALSSAVYKTPGIATKRHEKEANKTAVPAL